MAQGYRFPIVGWRGKVPTHWGSGERGGSDLFAAKGTPLVVMCGGVVTYAGQDPVGGWNVLIKGTDQLDYYLAHMNKRPLVRTGERVTTGQPLGEVGDTGNAAGTGAHLHIGIGHGIRTGGGPSGGCGIAFDAVGLLQRTLDEPEEDMARIEELEAALGECQSYSGAVAADVIGPTVAEMDREAENPTFDQGWVKVWADRLRPHAPSEP